MTITQLETIVRKNKISAALRPFNVGTEIGDAVTILAPYSNTTLLTDILRENRVRNASVVHLMDEIWSHYIDVETVVASDANMLNGRSHEGWKGQYFQSLATFTLDGGEVSYISNDWRHGHQDEWRARKFADNRVVAVTSVEETEWSTFVETFVDNDEQVGLRADVLYDNGYSGVVVKQCSLRDALDAIL